MRFIKTPFMPDDKVSLAIADFRISHEMEEKLSAEGVECLKTVRCKELYEAVEGHPDMMLLHLGGNKVVVAPNIYEEMAPILEKKGFAVTKGATWLVRNYPGNIAYNVLIMGNLVFHNIKYTDPVVIEELEKDNKILVNVSQGYTKCSVCILDSRTIITSDIKISETAEKYGIESLLIKPGGIGLKNMSYGFIGGASGLISDKNISFAGKLDCLEDCEEVLSYIKKKGFEITELSKGKLIDYGSVIPLKCY